jgi:hypothetical protein
LEEAVGPCSSFSADLLAFYFLQLLEKVEIEYVPEKPALEGGEGYEELLEVFNKFTPSEDTSKADVSGKLPPLANGPNLVLSKSC